MTEGSFDLSLIGGGGGGGGEDYRGKDNVTPVNLVAVLGGTRFSTTDDGIIIVDGFEFSHPISLQPVRSHLSWQVLGAICALPDGHLSTSNTSNTLNTSITTHKHLARCDIRRLLPKSNNTTVPCTVRSAHYKHNGPHIQNLFGRGVCTDVQALRESSSR